MDRFDESNPSCPMDGSNESNHSSPLVYTRSVLISFPHYCRRNFTNRTDGVHSTVLDNPPLIGLHAFSGNDYVSAFFCKGKCAFWKAMLKQSQFLEAFCHLEKELEVTNNLFKVLEKFICFLYAFPKYEEMNALRRSIFWDKFKKRSKWLNLACCHHVVIIFNFT